MMILPMKRLSAGEALADPRSALGAELKSKVEVMRPVYCSSDGGRSAGLIRALVRGWKSLPAWPPFAGRVNVGTYLGRVAVWQLCRFWELGPGDEVLAPAYNCGSEISPLVTSGVAVRFYRVDRNARIDVGDIRRRVTERTRAIYVIHYFGWIQDLSSLRGWCQERGLKLVEDCALSLFSQGPEGWAGSCADAAIYSLRKFLPVPDGGVLSLRAGAEETFGLHWPPVKQTVRNCLPLVKRQIIRGIERAGLYAALRRTQLRRRRPQIPTSPPGLPDMPADYYFDVGIANQSISRTSLGLLRQFDPEMICTRRRANYAELRDRIQGIGGITCLFEDLPEGVCPMAMPVLVEDRNNLVAKLNAHGIACFAFWEGYHAALDWKPFPEARYLKDHLVTLPVHQAQTSVHIRYIATVLRQVMATAGGKDAAPLEHPTEKEDELRAK